MTLRRDQVFEEQAIRHHTYVEMVRGDLRQMPLLRKFFDDAMRELGLAVILRDYFPSEENIVRFESGKTLTARDSSSATFVSPKPIRKDGQRSDIGADELAFFRSADDITPVMKVEPSLLRESWVKARKERALAADVAALPASAARDLNGPSAIVPTPQRIADLRALTEALQIPHLVHFTRCENLPSIMRHGLCSVAVCGVARIPAIRNDDMRLDGALDGISLSIAFPNYRMFYKYRKLAPEADWAVLILSPEILWTKSCGFFWLNAADHRMRDIPREEMMTTHAFRKMFETSGVTRDALLRSYDPSDSQAEVMVYERIEPSLIAAVGFETKNCMDRWAHTARGTDTIHMGLGKGMFGTLARARAQMISPSRYN